MSLTRRTFVQSVGVGAAGALAGSYIGARGRENAIWSAFEPTLEAIKPGVICLASNENPVGPGKTVLDAVRAAFGAEGRTPGRYDYGGGGLLIELIAKKFNVKTENVVLGCGSTQILRSATHLFTAKDKPLVGTIPTYEECAGYAEMIGAPVRDVARLGLQDRSGQDGRRVEGAGSSSTATRTTRRRPTSARGGARVPRHDRAVAPGHRLVDGRIDCVTRPGPDTCRSRSTTRASSWRGRSRGLRHGGAAHRIAPSATRTPSSRWPSSTPAPARRRSTCSPCARDRRARAGSNYIVAERARATAVRDFTMKWFADRGMKRPTRRPTSFASTSGGGGKSAATRAATRASRRATSAVREDAAGSPTARWKRCRSRSGVRRRSGRRRHRRRRTFRT